MEIADPEVHRLLAYIAAVNDQGVALPVEAAELYGSEPRRTIGPWFGGLTLNFPGGEVENWTTYLTRLRWANTSMRNGKQAIALTELGRAVLRHLERGEASPESGGALAIRANDPLSYAQVIGRIARHDDGLLVDAYLTSDALYYVLAQTRISRILTSRKGREQERRIGEMVVLLSRFDAGRLVELRASDGIHDRFVIPESGPVETLGTSMSGIGKHLSTYQEVHGAVGDAIRDAHEALWHSAEALHQPPSEDESEPARTA